MLTIPLARNWDRKDMIEICANMFIFRPWLHVNGSRSSGTGCGNNGKPNGSSNIALCNGGPMVGFHGLDSSDWFSALSSSFSSMGNRRGCFLNRFGPALALDSDGIAGIPVNGSTKRRSNWQVDCPSNLRPGQKAQ